MWVMLITMLIAMSLATVAAIIYDYDKSKKALERELTVISKIIMERSRAAISFRDKKAAKSNLNSLGINNSVEQACFYLITGELFVSYHKINTNTGLCPQYNQSEKDIIYKDNYLYIKQFAVLNKKPIAVVKIKAGLGKIKQRLHDFTIVALFILFVAAMIVYFVTQRLIKHLISPLFSLNKLATTVTERNDYSLRAEKESDDEIGSLVDSFNQMLNTIQLNEMQLKEAMYELDEKNMLNEAKALTAEEKHEAFKEFFSGVSHDLKQPLNAMGLFMEGLKGTDNRQKQLEIIEKFDRSLANLNQMFTGLLDKSRFEQGLTKVNIEKIELCSIFKTIENEFSILAKDKGIKFSVFCREKIVFSDPQILERIIRNLVSNAVKFTDNGGVLLASRKRKGHVWIDIWDSGKGIEDKNISEIFKSHVQLDNPNHNPKKGYGIGLSVVKKLAENLGSTIEVKSEPGKGTVMRLKIAVTESENKQKEFANVISDNKNDTHLLTDPLFGLDVLIVDDDQNILDATQIILQNWGMNVYSANTYNEALNLAEQVDYKFNIVLADYHLGNNQYGGDLIEELINKSGQKISSIIVSGEAPEFLESLREVGFNVLGKPIKSSRLRAMMNHCITIENSKQ